MAATGVVTHEGMGDGTIRDAGETSKEPDDHLGDVGVRIGRRVGDTTRGDDDGVGSRKRVVGDQGIVVKWNLMVKQS
nr:hypothetical protein [Tanacetum cinerariifolium]